LSDSFAPDTTLNSRERQELAMIIAQPGFKVMQNLWKSCVSSFNLALINTPEDSTDLIVARHRSAKVAAQLYTLFVNRINEEVFNINNAPRPYDKPLDISNDLDIGEYTKYGADIEEEEPF
jgi:hypothetical protein